MWMWHAIIEYQPHPMKLQKIKPLKGGQQNNYQQYAAARYAPCICKEARQHASHSE